MKRKQLSILFTIITIALLSGCRKELKRVETSFSILGTVPYDGTPLPKIRYTVVEYQYLTKRGKNVGTPYPTGWKLKGYTDQNGKASGMFPAMAGTDYFYTINFFYSEVKLPPDFGPSFRVRAPLHANLHKGSGKKNFFEVRLLEYAAINFRIYNVACETFNDSLRYSTYNYDDTPDLTFESLGFPNKYYTGCGTLVNYYAPDSVAAGHQVFKLQMKSNGIVTTRIDTFLLKPHILNQVDIVF